MMITGNKYHWSIPEHDTQAIADLAATTQLAIPIAATLYHRGYTTPETVQQYIMLQEHEVVADPALLSDSMRAVERIIRALERQEKILIAGDYDVDGITSTSLLLLCLLPLDARINFFLPHRVHDGYGLSIKTIERAAESGYSLVITVDNGITAFEPARRARELGIDLIITDHHKPYSELPPAYAVVDPHRLDCAYPYKMFAGVGVGFKLMSLLYQLLGKELPEQVYELLMLGTIADVVPLTGENRFWVKRGLESIHKQRSFALTVLQQNARLSKPTLSSTDVGFFIAPQINALGRLQDARSGVRFLLGSDQQEVLEVGTLLHDLNESRKAIERGVTQEIKERLALEGFSPQEHKIIIITGSGWPPGVIGLVAGRLVGEYCVPAIVLHESADGVLKGSCRSTTKCDIFSMLSSVQDILLTFGGHPMAAGLSLKKENLEAFVVRMRVLAQKMITDADLIRMLSCDASLLLSDITHRCMQGLAFLEPFGCGNPQPTFYIRNVTLIKTPQLLKEQHVKIAVFSEGVIKSVIFFNRPELYDIFLHQGDIPFHIAANVVQNYWDGKVTYELQGIDIAL